MKTGSTTCKELRVSRKSDLNFIVIYLLSLNTEKSFLSKKQQHSNKNM